MRILSPTLALAVSASLLVACGSSDKGSFRITGRAPALTATQGALVAARSGALASSSGRTITHVMAVDPETASPRRMLSKVGADGSFALTVDAGRPYVLVFIDSSAVGADMVVAIFRDQTLDTITPVDAGGVNLGDVEVDTDKKTATTAVPYDTLLASLGLSASAAEYLGSIDDLSLRYANPDIDGDGIIDITQQHPFSLDFHIRSNMLRGPGGPHLTIDDLTDKFFASEGADVATPDFNLASIYALYPASFDGTAYVDRMAPPGAPLQHGGGYTVTLADGSTPAANTSYSALMFNDTAGFGADYAFGSTPGLELPGSGGVPATLVYTLGGVGKQLTFNNVITRTRASLTEVGTLSIFLRLNTTAGSIASIDFEWRKRVAGGNWILATEEEIALVISGAGGFISFHRVPSWNNEVQVAIPAAPSGTIAWSGAALSPGEICGMGVSYDDKLGLRHFEGGADPNPGVVCSP
jgi:hypothetical protein